MGESTTKIGVQSGGLGRAGSTPKSAADTELARQFTLLTQAIDNKNLQGLRGTLNSLNIYASRNTTGATLAVRICSGEQRIVGGLDSGKTLRQYCEAKGFTVGIDILNEFAQAQLAPQKPVAKAPTSTTSGRNRVSNSGLSLGALVAQISPKPNAPSAGAPTTTVLGVGGSTGHKGHSRGR